MEKKLILATLFILHIFTAYAAKDEPNNRRALTVDRSLSAKPKRTSVKKQSVIRDGGWASWSEWSSWAKGQCSGNIRVKTRACSNPIPYEEKDYCDGEASISENGPIDGGLTEWSQWSNCEAPCGGSIVNRTRTCNNPPPERGGADCAGNMVETKLECIIQCPEKRTDGGWSPWSPWPECPKTCTKNGGIRLTRYRQCNMPPPYYGGAVCPGNSTDDELRCFHICPLNGGFGSWSQFGECSKTCGSGVLIRTRACNNPEPKGQSAKNCTGSYTDTKHCKLAPCVGAIDGNWATWTSWNQCTESTWCNKGTHSRKRMCTNPAPNKGGDDCKGNGEEKEICPTKNCQTFVPTSAPTRPVFAGEYIDRECGGVKLKHIGTSAPQGVLNHLKFQLSKFKSGYYGTVEEEKGKIQKYCFEPYPPMSIKEAADHITSYRKTDPIKEYTKPSDESMPILGFSIRVQNDGTHKLKGWDFGINEVSEYLPGNRVKLHNTMFTYFSEGTFFSFLAKGDFELFKPTIFKCVLFRNGTFLNPLDSMECTASSMKLKSLVNAIGLPDDVDGIAGSVIKAIKNLKIWEFEFAPLSLAYDYKHEFKAPIRITATRKFGGIPLHFEVLYIHSGWDRKIAFGFVFDGDSYGAMLEKLSGSGAVGGLVSKFLKMLGTQLEVGLAWCPSYFGEFRVSMATRFGKQPLRDLYKYEIPKGLTAVAQVSIPKDCSDSSTCKILKAIVGPKAAFRISGLVRANYFKVKGGFYNVRIYGDVSFSKLELYLEVNYNETAKKREVGFVAEVQIPINKGQVYVDGILQERYLKLGGVIKHELGTALATGALYMKGMWYHAFGLNWLNLGNIYIALSVKAGSPIGFAGFQLGGQLEFGKDCLYDADFAEDGHCLRIAIYFGIGKPQYIYGKISSLTIGKLVRMCGSSTASVPKPVSRSGFPKGLRVQYNPSDKDVDLRPYGGPLVQKGFRLKGVLNLFEYEIKAHIKYSEREILIDGELDPINLGGHVILSRNKTHKNVGPRLLFHYKKAVKTDLIKLPYFKLYFEGYAKILGIEAYAYLNVTMSGLEIYIYGKVWNLMYCELYIAAGYDYANIADAHFYIRVIVDLRGLTDAIEKARKAVDGAFKEAQATLRAAIEKVKGAKRKCKEKLKLKCSNCHSLKCKQAEDGCKGFLSAAGKWLGGAVNSVGNWVKGAGKTIGRGLAKVGKWFKSWRRRRAVREFRDSDFDIHIRNKRFLSKILCEGLVGGGCKGVSALCYGSCKVVNYIGQGLCNIVDVAVWALKAAETACGWINSAIQFLMQLFLIHGIRFELGLGQKFNGFMVGAEIDLTLFGKRMYFGFKFDLKNPFRSITDAKDGSLYRYKEGVRQLRTGPTYNPYDRPNPFTDFNIAGTFGIEASETATENRVGSCIAALNGNDKANLVLVACNATNKLQRWQYTLKGALINLQTKKCLTFPQKAGGKLHQRDCEKDQLSQQHECDVVTRTLKLRRKNLCVTKAKSSPLGPGSLTHHGSLKCVHVAPSQNLVLRTVCNRQDTEFVLDSKTSYLIFNLKKSCVRAERGNAVIGAKLQVVPKSMGCHEFAFTTLGSLQHKKSGLCVQTKNKAMIPKDYTELILSDRCEYTTPNRKTGALADSQMVFSFVPQDNTLTMNECGSFYEGKLDQRFVVMDEELYSVCSKFSVDLALNKIASQSSVQHNGFPSRAVDGNFNYQWEKGSCTHTKEEQDPWLRVDLGSEYIVTDVTIINRGEHGDRFKNVQVHVGPSLRNKKNPVCHDIVRFAADGEAVRVQCNPPIPGRFVSLQMYGKGILSVCEVVVASRVGAMADWCQIENGGCEQLCYNQCDMKTTCGCLPGYRLVYDGKSCIDIDECLVNNGGCRTDKNAYCKNYPGGHYCACTDGYILEDNSATACVDINECGIKSGGCEQMCNNTLGGYMCTCRKGFERKPNSSYGCQNIDECLVNKGGCGHSCFDYHGGHYCKCQMGYRLKEDGRSCEELYCSVLEAPRYGYVQPSTCAKKYENIRAGTVCTTQCLKGYEISKLSVSTSVSCRIDGTWNHASPSCHAVQCPILPRPKNGGVVPARCHDDNRGFNEYGQRCVSYCKHGYRLRGPATKYCQADKAWSNENSVVECVKIYEPPYLNCPTDLVATLSASSSWMTVGSLWQNPQTNLNASLLTVFPPNVGPNYKFQYGRTLVAYQAISESGEFLACSYFVEIEDRTPPLITNCPSDIAKTSSNDRMLINWIEPTFTDNVGIRLLTKPVRAPGDIWLNGESMTLQYSAIDEAGNDQVCSFKVSFKSILCPEMKSTIETTVQMLASRRRYTVACTSVDKTFFGSYDTYGSMIECVNGDYMMDATNIGSDPPECVGFEPSTEKGVCKDGSVKFMFDDLFTGQVYYCAQCPTGHSFNSSSKSCELCGVGKYQDDQGKLTCEFCPKGQLTKSTGSRSLKECLDQCKPGYFSDSGLDEPNQLCRPCPKGTYSQINGTTKCDACADKETTMKPGATHQSQCLKTLRITNTVPSHVASTVEGSYITLECMFEGKPTPDVTWSKVSGSLPRDHTTEILYDIFLKDIGSSITLYKLTVADSGHYKCTAINTLGKDEKTIEVVVKPNNKK